MIRPRSLMSVAVVATALGTSTASPLLLPARGRWRSRRCAPATGSTWPRVPAVIRIVECPSSSIRSAAPRRGRTGTSRTRAADPVGAAIQDRCRLAGESTTLSRRRRRRCRNCLAGPRCTCGFIESRAPVGPQWLSDTAEMLQAHRARHREALTPAAAVGQVGPAAGDSDFPIHPEQQRKLVWVAAFVAPGEVEGGQRRSGAGRSDGRNGVVRQETAERGLAEGRVLAVVQDHLVPQVAHSDRRHRQSRFGLAGDHPEPLARRGLDLTDLLGANLFVLEGEPLTYAARELEGVDGLDPTSRIVIP